MEMLQPSNPRRLHSIICEANHTIFRMMALVCSLALLWQAGGILVSPILVRICAGTVPSFAPSHLTGFLLTTGSKQLLALTAIQPGCTKHLEFSTSLACPGQDD